MLNSSQLGQHQIFGPNLTKITKLTNDKTFEKINIKIVIRIQQCTPVPNFS